METHLASLTAPQLRALQSHYDELFINADRKAVQILDCNRRVLITLNLTAQQTADLYGSN